MRKITKYTIWSWLAVMVSLIAMWGCANRGMGPQGGPKDETPPVVVKETPLNGSVDFMGQDVVLQFDEYVVLQDAANQVLISPPQKKAPVVRAVGKKVMVEFEEPLRDSTTYTINFGSAICDNNERNPLKDYSFSFSTGPYIDSLEVSGVVIDAETLNPVMGIYVGVHSDLSDTALSTMPFRHIARTNENGEFLIRNVSSGTYHLFALNDMSKDYLYQPGEGIAFMDTLFVPEAVNEVQIDTTWIVTYDTIQVAAAMDSARLDMDTEWGRAMASLTKDTVIADSVASTSEKQVTVYHPKDIILKYFVENKQKHYFQRCKREEQRSFVMTFSAPQDEMPLITWNYEMDSLTGEPLDSIRESAFIVQANDKKDTITVWITDSAYIMQDTLSFLLTYMYTDSLYNLVPQTDTLQAIYRAPRLTEKAKEALEKKRLNSKLEFKTNASKSFEVYNPLLLDFTTPLAQWHKDSVHVVELHDTVRVPVPVEMECMDSSAMRLAIRYDWKPEFSYEVQVDSAAFTDVYGLTNDEQKATWKVKSLEEYSTLIIKVEPFDANMMVQVLSEKDVPVRTLRAKEEGVRFEYLKPHSYYVRIYNDANGDSIWTTGDYQKHIQPEEMYYFSTKLTLRANWDFEETVLYLEKGILEQKPTEIRKALGQQKK